MTNPQGRLALRKGEAASALAMSVDSFERHVLPDLKTIRRGRFVLIAIAELNRWIERNQAVVIEDAA